MGTILIHAGMPKTGSSSVQRWLAAHAGTLRDVHGISILRWDRGSSGAPRGFTTFDAGTTAHCPRFPLLYEAARRGEASRADLAALAARFVEGLDRAATDLGIVLVTAETYATFFVDGEEPFLHALDGLARDHDVRVTYYVRPQHTALESRWCQWGFRTSLPPAEWVDAEERHLRYRSTWARTTQLAPHVDFDLRPFRRDLLADGDVVVDFARNVLGIRPVPGAGTFRDRPGLPLDLANLLRGAPAALLRSSASSGTGIDAGVRRRDLGALGREWDVPDSAEARRSRSVLHEHAFRTFEDDNQVLIDELAWPTDAFVPRPPERAAGEGPQDADALEDLDHLWDPAASTVAPDYLYAALGTLFDESGPPEHPPGARARDRGAGRGPRERTSGRSPRR